MGHDQTVVYTVVIFALWNIPGARVLINPLKLLTIGWHELSHIVAVRRDVILLSPISQRTDLALRQYSPGA